MRRRLSGWLNRLPWDSRTRRALDQTFLDWAQEQRVARTAAEGLISAARSAFSVGRVLTLGLVDEACRASLSPIAGRIVLVLLALMAFDVVRAVLSLRVSGGFLIPNVAMYRDHMVFASTSLVPSIGGVMVLDGFLRVLPLALFLAVGLLSRPTRRIVGTSGVGRAVLPAPSAVTLTAHRVHDVPSPPLIGLALVVVGAVVVVAGWLYPMTLAHLHGEIVDLLSGARVPNSFVDRSYQERSLLDLFRALRDPAMSQPWALLSELGLRWCWILLAPAALMFGAVTRRMTGFGYRAAATVFLGLYVWTVLLDHLQSWHLIFLRFTVPLVLPLAILCAALIFTGMGRRSP